MPVPAFDERGLLPPVIGENLVDINRSPYYVTMTEFAQAFGTTAHRRSLISKLIAYRTLIAADGYTSGVQFLDGSFVEDIEKHSNRPPNDIDVFSFLYAPLKYHEDPHIWTDIGRPYWEQQIANQPLNKERFSLDTYAVLLEELSLIGMLQNVTYWHGLFSHQRDTQNWKGFVAIPLAPDQDANAIVLLGEV